MPFGCRVQGRRGPGGSARAAPSLLWPDCQTVVAPLVALGTDAGQGSLIGEQQQLERLGHRADFRRVGMIHRKVYHMGPIRSGAMGRPARKNEGCCAV